ncbi:MAG TPA: RNA polymerase sigma factor, partial [Isosphaeraceae bacterium]|nr:RNA polymerase sigma factor [Isosphaeraceae bacterium]
KVLDEELQKLPARFRDPLVLCYLHGRSHDEAAALLRWPVGTIRSRMARGRERLKGRLERRGIVGLSVAGLTAVLQAESAQAITLPPALVGSTVSVALQVLAGSSLTGGVVSLGATSLSEGVLTAMRMSTWKLVAGRLFFLGAAGGGVVAISQVRGQGPSSAERALQRLNATLDEAQAQVKQARIRESELTAKVRELEKKLASVRNGGRSEEGMAGMEGAADLMGNVGASDHGAMPSSPDMNMMSPSSRPGSGMMMPGMAGGMMPGAAMMSRGGSSEMMSRGENPEVIKPVNEPQREFVDKVARTIIEDMPRIETLSNKSLVVPVSASDQMLQVYSVESGKWYPWGPIEGVKIRPILSEDLLALAQAGEKVETLAVFAKSRNGWGWNSYRLDEPCTKEVPLVDANTAVFVIGRRVYAFSATTGTWGDLVLSEGTKPVPQIQEKYVTVEDGRRLCVFSDLTGSWSSVEVPARK